METIPLNQLKDLFDTVRSRYPRLPVLAIQWIYLTNGRYEVQKWIERANSLSTFVALLTRTGWNFIKCFFLMAQVFLIRFVSQKVYRRLKTESFEAIVKTYGFPHSSLKNGDDFYFGNLSERLEKNNLNLLSLYGNAKEKHWYNFLSSHTSSSFPHQICELNFIAPWNIMSLWFDQFKTAFYIFFAGVREKDVLLKKTLFLVSKESLRHHTLRNALFYFIGKKVCKLWKPKFFISLYEGHSWEKCLWMGIKSVLPACKIVAYQHTVIFERTLSLREPSFNEASFSKPDVVLCTGPRTLEIMRDSHESSQVQLVPFGSFRCGPAQGVREPVPSKKTILVLPEGLVSESKILFDAAIELARKFKDYSFIFRTHPALPFRKVLPHLQKNPATVSNIILSEEKDIETDFDRSSVLLYRGSSSVLYGILKGVKPFYFRQGDEELIDPLFELQDFREYTTSVDELGKKLELYEAGDLEEILPDWKRAAKYVRDYTKPVNDESMRQLLERVNL